MTLRVAKQWICQAMQQRLLDILRLSPWENVRFALKANGCVDWTWLVLLFHAPLFARRWDCSGYVNFGVWQLVRCSSSGDMSEPSTFDTWLCVCVRTSLPIFIAWVPGVEIDLSRGKAPAVFGRSLNRYSRENKDQADECLPLASFFS